MSEFDFNRDEIKKRLLALNNARLNTAFTARIIAIILPRLTDGIKKQKQFLWFWNKNSKKRFLFDILRAWQSVWGRVLLTKSSLSMSLEFIEHIETLSHAATFFSTIFSIKIANTDNISSNVINLESFSSFAADAANFVFCASYSENPAESYTISFSWLVNHYLENLENNQNITEFLEKPFTGFWKEEQELFIQELKKLGDGFDYWADWYEARVKGEHLDEELMLKNSSLPSEILAQSPAQINAYLKSLRDNYATTPLNRVRVIFMGYGEAGKTSIIRVLNGETVVEGKEPMTPGIDIHEWTVPDDKPELNKKPDNPLIANLWDFGGQVMAHATHQFFLRSRCLYIIVLNARSEISADEQAEYWLKHVRAFGGNAPVMIVANRLDEGTLNLNMFYLCDKYKENIVGSYPLSCTQANGNKKAEFERFKRDFIEQLHKVGTHQVLFGKSHFAVLEELRKRSSKQSFLSKNIFTKLCKQHGIQKENELNQTWLLELLDTLGVIIHFSKMKRLTEYVLNPRWITYGIYTILYSETAKEARGVLHENDVFKILGNKKLKDNRGSQLNYPENKCSFIIDAMEEFELSYRLPADKNTLIIPALLPSDTPSLTFNKNDALAFDFDFQGFLPRHLITGLIVRRHDEIENNTVWQNGVQLQSPDKGAHALIQANYHERRLSLWVKGTQANRYFAVLHDEVLQLVKRMLDLQYKEWVKLPHYDPNARAIYRDLLALEQAKRKDYICEYGTFDLQDLLKNITPKAKRERTVINNTFNVDQIIGDKKMGDINATNIGIAQQGNNNTATMRDQNNAASENAATAPSLEEVRAELENLRKIFAGLIIADKPKVERALADAKDELDKAQPDKQEIAEALDRALKNAKKAGALTKEFQESILQPLEKLAAWCSINIAQYFL